ncbi:alpha/beta fold hydrolase [uncultured Roseobacter sp.]|uniref:alpha/beta fold hydrolase n=1 Tax=uncultured Roseobacter sp. TaxID=114847 RepID=UPI00261A103C|nr:alpha/beta fold hydrolase [uncultured Roseobacter sp.]
MTSHSEARVWGAGPYPALAIHCTLGHSGMWRGVAGHLSDLLTFTAFDLPGHGHGPAWDSTTDLHRACCDTALPHLAEPQHLIGHSFGATVALRLAVENPQMVRSLTLIEPVFFAALNGTGQAHLAAHLKSAKPWTEAIERGDFAVAARLFNRQ